MSKFFRQAIGRHLRFIRYIARKMPEMTCLTKEIAEQILILLTCRDEKEQVDLLCRFTGEGLQCKALVG
jgi:hypothetical protein